MFHCIKTDFQNTSVKILEAHFNMILLPTVQALMSFQFNVFFLKKCLKCLASSSYLLEPKKSIFNRWFWNNNQLEHLKYKILIKVFQYILKPIETFLIQNCFLAIPKYVNKTKKNRDKFWSDNRFLNEKTLN